MRDFSMAIYRRLLDALEKAGYHFQTFSDYLSKPAKRPIMLRHDVDDRKLHALEFATLQHKRGIAGVYYFRIVPRSFDEGLIRAIHHMGHEIGYHYEDMDLARGDPKRAIELFAHHLERMRAIAPVSTICMHGSPRSRHDNRDLWKYHDRRDFGIIGEPYFDIDFNKVFYLTDTGRTWNGHKVSRRDKVDSPFALSFKTTSDIIQAIEEGRFPQAAMFNFHPQRWTDDSRLWFREKYLQSFKNIVKYWLIHWT
jgi:hypothetical protein